VLLAAAVRSLEHDSGPSLEAANSLPLLVMTAVEKSFGTTKAVQQVDFEVRPSEIVALMGGNGAGKSTLMKIVGGLVTPDSGDIQLFGRSIGGEHSPRAAMELGIRFVHQELSLCPNLRGFENFSIELPDIIRGLRWKRLAIKLAKAALDDVFPGNSIDPRVKVGALSLSQQQMVEIARAASHPATKLLILDEPTSSLGSREAVQLRNYIKRRRDQGISFIFISHRLQESLDVADRVVVMRNGRIGWTGSTSAISHDGLLEQLGGKQAEAVVVQTNVDVNLEPVVEVSGLRDDILRGVSFVVRRGEIVGLAGLEGSGQRQVLHSVFERSRRGDEEVNVKGRVAFVSGDRTAEGIFQLWSINDNIAASSFGRLARWGLISASRVSELTSGWFDRLKIQAESGAVRIVSLSGGNQQKAVIARALAAQANVILLDDPTRGVDVGTKADLYQLFRELAGQGRTVLWYSTDDTEFKQCDRTLVLRDGAIVAEFRRDDVSEEQLIDASFRSVEASGAATHARVVSVRARQREAIVSAAIPLVTFAVVFALSVLLNSRILSPFGLTLVFSAAFALAFAATSQLFIIAAGDIDLGLGNFIGLVNVVAATWLITDPLLAALCFAGMLLAYPVMGLFVEARRVPAIIVTLGLSFVWLGLAALRLPRAGGSAPQWLVELLRVKIPVIPLPVLLCILPAVLAYLVLMVWRYGAVLRGYGASPRAIEAAGWSTRMAKASLYGFGGLFAILTGILMTGSTRGGDPTGSTSMTLLSVAAVILGGAAFSGGIVSPFGAVFGTLSLVLVGTLLALIGVNSIFLPMIQGLLLLGVVGVRTLVLGVSSK
jgi:ribose transport system ATP-binding protein